MTGYPVPEIGAVLERKGQRYTFCGQPREHVTRDGRTVTLYAWQSHCVECGAEFEFPALTSLARNAKRRCVACAGKYILPKLTSKERAEKARRKDARRKARAAIDPEYAARKREQNRAKCAAYAARQKAARRSDNAD